MKLALLLLVCGCDALFGFDHVPLVIDAAPDSATRTITCDYSWKIASVSPDGTPRELEQPPPLNYAHAVAGGLQIPIAADGTFQFTARSGKPYELMFEGPTNTSYFDRSSDMCHIVGYFTHRQGAAPLNAATPVRFDIAGTAPVNTIVRVTSTGQRTYLAPTFSMTSSWTVDWAVATELDGSHAGLLDAAVGDRLYWLAMPVATDYYAIAQAAPAAVTLVNGQMTVIAASPSPVPQRCVNVQSGEGTIAAMMQAAAPRASGSPLSSWAITSSAIPDVGVGEGQPLAVTRRADVVDHTLTVSYGNPYPGESDELQIGVALAYKLSLGAGAATTIYSSLSYYDLITADGSCSTTVTPQLPPVAFASGPSIAGVPLTADDQPLALDRSAPIPVHVTVDGSTELLVFLDEVTVTNGTTTLAPIATFFPLAGDFTIDPSLLTVGHTYIMYMQTRRGFPNALEFDYGTVSYPAVSATFPTTSFSITR